MAALVKPTRLWVAAALAFAPPLGGCAAPPPGPAPTPPAWNWGLPAGVPPPAVPADNPMSPQKAELGRWLFYDKRLSVDSSTSCASCHVQALAFTDGRARSLGATGHSTPRSSMALANVAYHPVLTWGNPLMTSLEVQALVPLTSEEPLEMGFSRRPQEILQTLREDPGLAERFGASFPEDPEPVRLGNITKALATFQRTLLSFNSPYDRAARGDSEAMTPAARRGHTLFFSERLECFHCHDAPFFSDSTQVAGLPAVTLFHNTGLYAIGPNQRYPEGSTGVFEVTGSPNDMGKFRAPTLRNIAVTAPYFHDGSAATLAEVLDHYRVGGRTLTEGPHAGVGAKQRLKSPFIRGFELSEAEKADLVAFLESLTDESFLTHPAFADPFAH